VSKHLAQGEHRKADYLAANPQGLVPALEHRGTLFTQSLAIIEYLDSVVTQPRLLPQDPVDRAHVSAMAQAIACDIHPLNNLRVTNYLKQQLAQDENAVQGWYAHWIQEGFHAMEAWAVQRSSSRRYLYADAVSLADVVLVPQMYNARRFNVSLEAFPALVAIDRHLCTLPAFIAASPEHQPDMN